MAIYVTSDGSPKQEWIASVICKMGTIRLVNTAQLKANDTVIIQGTKISANLSGLVHFPQPLTLIAWLPTYDWSINISNELIHFCRQCAAIVVPTERAKDWLIKQNITSEKITICPLIGNTSVNVQPKFSQQVHRFLPAQMPRSVAIAKLNQAGGWGELNTARENLTYPEKIIDFISAGLPLLVTAKAPAAELIDRYQIGLHYTNKQELQDLLKQVTANKYQQFANNVRRVSKMISHNYFIQQAFTQVCYQASVSSIDATKQHPRFNIHVLNSLETLDYIERYHPSVARLGDGEITLMLGFSTNQIFQSTDELLERRLREIVETPSSPRLLVCLDDTFHDIGRLVPKAQSWWNGHQRVFASFYRQLGNLKNVYGNAMVTRPYIDLQDRSQAGKIFHRIKRWWTNRDLLIVEGAYTRSGVGNNLYDNARSVQRIICPPKNAWAKYQEIEKAIKKYGENKLVLVMLGMTATVIAADLADWGQVIDFGHLDSEYEWYRQGAVTRVSIQGKHTAEMNHDKEIPKTIDDPQYNAEIILNLNEWQIVKFKLNILVDRKTHKGL